MPDTSWPHLPRRRRRLLGKQSQQFPLKGGEGNFPYGLAGIHQDVPARREARAIQPKDLAHAPPQAVAPHGIPQACRRGDSQA